MKLRQILREPLLHFLLLGAAIFIIHRVVAQPAGEEPGRIVITQGQIETMTVGFSRTWQRPPTSQELEALIRDRVREEIYYREALAMGLDRDDTIIRRRLRQKLEFISDDVITLAEPTEADLAAYLKTHAEAFRRESQLTFSQVYLSPDKHGERLTQDAAQLLNQLRQAGHAPDLSSLGDSFLLERRFQAAPVTEVTKQFGEKFTIGLSGLPLGQWHGPIQSGFGAHLVLVEQRTEGRLPDLAEARDAVQREWTNARRLESNEKFFQTLLKRYAVTVEKAEPADASKKIARSK